MTLTLDCTFHTRCSSYLLTLVPDSGTDLIMSYWPATTDESKANDFAGVSKASVPCRCPACTCMPVGPQCGICDAAPHESREGPNTSPAHPLALACRSAPAPCPSLAARWWASTLAPQTAQRVLTTTVQRWTAAAPGALGAPAGAVCACWILQKTTGQGQGSCWAGSSVAGNATSMPTPNVCSPVGNTCAQGSTTPTACGAGAWAAGWEGAGVCNVRLLVAIACSGCIINSASACRLPADYYQPYLGGASCKVCNPSADPRYTSNAGDDYCLVEWVNTTCGNGENKVGCLCKRQLRHPPKASRAFRSQQQGLLPLTKHGQFHFKALTTCLHPSLTTPCAACRPGVRPRLQDLPALRRRLCAQRDAGERLRALVSCSAWLCCAARQLAAV